MTAVTMPDGTLVEMPDQISPEQRAALQKLLPPEGMPSPVRAGVRGIVRGLFSVPEMISNLAAPSKGMETALQSMSKTPLSPNPTVESLLSRVVAKPEGASRYLEEGIAGGTGALTFPGSIVPKIVAGAGGGVGGETAANLLEDKPWARVAGALAGGPLAYAGLQGGKLIRSLLGGPSTATPTVVSETARGTTPTEWDKMIAAREAGRDLGVPIIGTQGLDRPSPLHALQEKVTGMSPELTAETAKQVPAARLAATRFLGSLAPEAEPAAVATRAQGAAEAAIEKARKFATTGTAPYYELTRKTVSDQEMLLPAIRAQLNAAQSPAAREFLESQVFGKLSGDKVQSVEELKNVINEAKTALKAPNIGDKGIDRHVMGKISTSLDELEKVVASASANRPLGHEVYKDIYERIVNPMRQSLTGKIAGVKGVVDEAVPPTTRILGELNAPTVRAESIHKLAADMTRAGDAQAFPALVRGTWEQNLEKAFAGAEGAAQTAPARFASALRGTAEQTAKRENFRATIAEVARANGGNQQAIDQAVVGAEKLMTVMEAAGRAKGGLGAMPAQGGGIVENIVLRGGAGAASGAQLRIFGPISDMLNRKAYKEIAGLLTSPTGLEQLRELAKFDLTKYRISGVSGATAATTLEAKER